MRPASFSRTHCPAYRKPSVSASEPANSAVVLTCVPERVGLSRRTGAPTFAPNRPRMPEPMSAPTLAEAVAQYGRDAYLLTIANDGPHTSFVSVDLKGNVIACAIGKSAARNIASKPNVSLFWPPREPGGYALVVNGTATGRREPSGLTRAEITLTKSVLHRAGPKPPQSDGTCPSDCRRIARPT
jgi:hypothetical protein